MFTKYKLNRDYLEDELHSKVQRWAGIGVFWHSNYFTSRGSHRGDRLARAPLNKAGTYTCSSPGMLGKSLGVQHFHLIHHHVLNSFMCESNQEKKTKHPASVWGLSGSKQMANKPLTQTNCCQMGTHRGHQHSTGWREESHLYQTAAFPHK